MQFKLANIPKLQSTSDHKQCDLRKPDLSCRVIRQETLSGALITPPERELNVKLCKYNTERLAIDEAVERYVGKD